MKRLTIGMVLLAAFLNGCQEAEHLLFDDVARVQMNEDKEILASFYYDDASVVRDTVYLTVNTIGEPENRERRIELEQIPEYDVKYVYDEKGNLADSVVTEKPNKAVPDVHYVAMDAEEMRPFLVIPANAVTAEIPVILLRDASLKHAEYRLCLRLKETSDFLLGERNKLSGTVVFSDKLSIPNFWNPTVERYYFGKYSERKHAFMNEVLQIHVTDDWYKTLSMDYAELKYVRNKLKAALTEYNENPDNLANGLAPMREKQDDPTSGLITFP